MPIEKPTTNPNQATERMGAVMPPRAEALSLTEIHKDEPNYVKQDIVNHQKLGYTLRRRSHDAVAYGSLLRGVKDRMRADNEAQRKTPTEWSPGAAAKWKNKETGAQGFMVSGTEKNSVYFLYLDAGKKIEKILPEADMEKIAKGLLEGKDPEKDQGVYPRVNNTQAIKNRAKKETYEKAAEEIRQFETKPRKTSGEWITVEAPNTDGKMETYAVIANGTGTPGETSLHFYRAK